MHRRSNKTAAPCPYWFLLLLTIQSKFSKNYCRIMNTANSTALRFASAKPHQLFIGGKREDACGGETFEVLDPGTGGFLARVASGSAGDVDRAVAAAQEAFTKSGWSTMPAKDRAAILCRLADLIDANLDVLAAIESLDVGKPVEKAAAFDIPHAAQTLRYYAELSIHAQARSPHSVAGFQSHTLRMPYGVCGFIFPWNFPFLLLGWGIAPALAAGNTVVIKPAEETPLSTVFFSHLVEEAGVPAGVINVITGSGKIAGAALAAHPGLKRISFTGSPEVGRLVGEACGRNLIPAKLELGGKGAAVVFNDVDAPAVAEALAGAITHNAGQVCCTASRWLVHEDILEPFLAAAKASMSGMRIGYGGDPDTQIGPVVSEKQRQRILGYLEKGARAGATTVLAGGPAEVPGYEKGFYVKPALLMGAPDNPCCLEEIFGPVAYVLPFREEKEAIALVNSSNYGLANSVWSADLDRANRVAEALVAGNSWINAHNVFSHGISYGGCNLSGCGGGVLGPETLDDYLRAQSIVRPHQAGDSAKRETDRTGSSTNPVITETI